MSSVLYDVPGPKAIVRNRILGVVTVAVILAIAAFIIWRMAESGQFSAQKWSIFTFTAVWEQILAATGAVLSAFAVSAIGALVFGFIFAVGRLSEHAWVRVPFTVVSEIFRAIPVLIFMMIMYYGLPSIGIRLSPFVAVVVALICYNGSVLAEAIRAGIASLPRGQSEAGYAIGLRKTGVMTLVLLPQAVRVMMPVIIAQLVVTLKDTALGSLITYEELLYLAKLIGGQLAYGRPYIPSAIVMGGIYIALCLALSGIAKLVERRLRKSPKIAGPAPAVATAADAGSETTTQVLAAQLVDRADEGGPGKRGDGRRGRG